MWKASLKNIFVGGMQLTIKRAHISDLMTVTFSERHEAKKDLLIPDNYLSHGNWGMKRDKYV